MNNKKEKAPIDDVHRDYTVLLDTKTGKLVDKEAMAMFLYLQKAIDYTYKHIKTKSRFPPIRELYREDRLRKAGLFGSSERQKNIRNEKPGEEIE